MSDPLIVWIVDDSKVDAHDAWKVVGQVKDAFSSNASVYWAASFDWYPGLRVAVNLALTPQQTSEYPDIVILDLCAETPDGEILRGNSFYQELRRWEVHKPEGNRALIVFWSIHQGRKDTD